MRGDNSVFEFVNSNFKVFNILNYYSNISQ